MIRAIITTSVLGLAAPAMASEAGGSGNPFSGDIGNALWTLVIFVIVLVAVLLLAVVAAAILVFLL